MEQRGNVIRPNFSEWKNPKSEGIEPFKAQPIDLSQKQPSTTENVIPLLRNPNRKTVGSDAFNLEYDSPPTRPELRRDIVSYLSEYRLQIQKHPYQLLFGRKADGRGEMTLRDEDHGESLSRKAERSIVSRKLKKQPIHREEAELEGISLLNDQLRFSQDGDTVLWASPPGPKEQGYGEYGFLFVGKVNKTSSRDTSLSMQAVRIEKPSIDQYNAAFSTLTGEDINYEHPESFLARPRIVHEDISEQNVDMVLQKHFSFIPNTDDRERANRIVQKMEPMIEDFLEVMQGGKKEERIKAFYALENYALKLKNQEIEQPGENVVYIDTRKKSPRLQDVIDRFGYKPPAVAGSCGSTGGSAFSNNLTSIGGSETVANSIFGDDEYGSLDFECTKGHKNSRPRGELIPTCTTCGESVAC